MEIELKYRMEEESVMEAIFQDPYIEMIKDKQTETSIEVYRIHINRCFRLLILILK